MELRSQEDVAAPGFAGRNRQAIQGILRIEESGNPHDGAPRYPIPHRDLSAVEIPAVVEDVDRAVKAFGRVPNLRHVLDPVRNSIPLYLNPESPFCKPLMSHNAKTHNVVLKVSVPKRTGRKRKRGSDEPWQGDVEIRDADTGAEQGADAAAAAAAGRSSENVFSASRLDEPGLLRRKLADNVGNYQVQAVGTIKQTHRFRGLADFYWDMSSSSFAQRFVDQVLPGDVDKLKEFKFTPGVDQSANVDIIPPPIFTHMSLPFNYFYSQNPYVRTTEDGETLNTTAVKQVGYFIGAEDPTPDGPQIPPDMTDPRMVEVIAQLEEAFEDRPVWTRRSLLNHLAGKLHNWNELKKYLNYAAYQFKGGPWRDGVVPYGVDPRTDPKYRVYQTLMFKLPRQKRARKNQTWQSLRRTQMGGTREFAKELSASHVFDGETYHTDGKVWQVCDITDPLLRELLDGARVRPAWSPSSGWYHGGLWAKVKAIMKVKLVAIQFGRHLAREDFSAILQVGDQTPVRSASATVHLPLPNLHLTSEELTLLRGREPPKKKSQGYNYNIRVRQQVKGGGVTGEAGQAAAAGAAAAAAETIGDGDGDAGEDETADVLAEMASENDSGDENSGSGEDEEEEEEEADIDDDDDDADDDDDDDGENDGDDDTVGLGIQIDPNLTVDSV
ncbi:Transcription factor tau subunit sfc1 [Escovopsis weberi]|uniref:Transcription factor tau subunit sfc1 n=1 Tax=Escovopsis weberi TaxID=150374 RepID=A0A0M8MQF1_ESCWE|nr:Transcription factor tau subunit sfc1 [Escovopsis weberi]